MKVLISTEYLNVSKKYDPIFSLFVSFFVADNQLQISFEGFQLWQEFIKNPFNDGGCRSTKRSKESSEVTKKTTFRRWSRRLTNSNVQLISPGLGFGVL